MVLAVYWSHCNTEHLEVGTLAPPQRELFLLHGLTAFEHGCKPSHKDRLCSQSNGRPVDEVRVKVISEDLAIMLAEGDGEEHSSEGLISSILEDDATEAVEANCVISVSPMELESEVAKSQHGSLPRARSLSHSADQESLSWGLDRIDSRSGQDGYVLARLRRRRGHLCTRHGVCVCHILSLRPQQLDGRTNVRQDQSRSAAATGFWVA